MDFEISNRYQEGIPLFGVYSGRLNSLALGVRGINCYFDRMLGPGETGKFNIQYLVKDKDIVSKIDPERDFRAYASFKHDLISESVENTWRGNPVIASLFGVGYSKVVDARNK